MRLRFAVLASLLALAVGAISTAASAAPRHNRGLTINAIPHSINAGEGVVIYGRLKGDNVGGKTIVLYHHLAGSHIGYTRIGVTTTDSRGFYEFTREEGVVETNRSWFALGPDNTHSRTVFERVAALVSTPVPSTTTPDTDHLVTFTGHVSPNHAFEHVLLQEQIGSSDDWKTIKAGHLGPGSDYTLAYRFRIPGARDIRVAFPRDVRNTTGVSDSVSITVQQAQVPDFTIMSSKPIVAYGDSATISGVLDKHSTTTAESGVAVVLCSRTLDQSQFSCGTTTTTGNDGSYSFTVTPTENALYQVRTSLPPKRHSAVLFEGVRDVVTMAASSSTANAGQTVTFTGSVTPDKAGHVIYLQRKGSDGDWHTVEVRLIRFNSTFDFRWTFGHPGADTFRARITGDKGNVGGASAPVTITVNPAPAATLPPAP